MKMTGGFRQDETFKRHVDTEEKSRTREINGEGERKRRREATRRRGRQTCHRRRKVRQLELLVQVYLN